MAKYGANSSIEFDVGGMKYDERSVEIKVKGYLQNEDGEIETREQLDYKAHATTLGVNIPLNGYGKHSSLGKVRMVGLKVRNRKYPFIVEQVSTSTRYKLSESQVTRNIRSI